MTDPTNDQPGSGDAGGLSLADCVKATCPWSGDPVSADSLTRYRGRVVGFCNPGCRDKFERAIAHFESAFDGG
jgi:hypothetical protein